MKDQNLSMTLISTVQSKMFGTDHLHINTDNRILRVSNNQNDLGSFRQGYRNRCNLIGRQSDICNFCV